MGHRMSSSSRPRNRHLQDAADENSAADNSLYSGFVNLGSSLSTSLYGLFGSSTAQNPAASRNINSNPPTTLQDCLKKFTLQLLFTHGQYFTDYIKLHGRKPPSEYELVNATLSIVAVGYVRVNQDFAEMAKQALIHASSENDTSNKTQEALCVYNALKTLSIIHKQMVRSTPSHVGKTSRTIEAIFESMNLSTDPDQYEQELEAAGQLLESHFRSQNRHSNP